VLRGGEKRLKWAIATLWCGLDTVLLPNLNDEGMIFIIKKMISFQVLMEEVLSGRVPGVFRDLRMAAQ